MPVVIGNHGWSVAIIVVAWCLSLPGCQENGKPDGTMNHLTRLLNEQKAEDKLRGTAVVDKALYIDDTYEVWMRELAPQVVPTISNAAHSAYIHVFERGKFRCTIPVDVRLGDWFPRVRFVGANTLVILSYLYTEREEIAPPYYMVQLHRVDRFRCDKLIEQEFQSGGRDDQDRFTYWFYEFIDTPLSDFALIKFRFRHDPSAAVPWQGVCEEVIDIDLKTP